MKLARTSFVIFNLFYCLSSLVACTHDEPTHIDPDTVKQAKTTVDLRNSGFEVRLTEPSDGELCEKFKTALKNNDDIIFNEISVPENYDNPNGRKININYYYIKSRMASGSTPVIFFNGGPGGSSFSSYKALVNKQSTDSKFNSINFVFIDQRGNGCSSPYPEVQTAQDVERLQYYTSRSIVKDAEQVRARIWANKAWKVFGQSYGGMIVRRYIEIAPQAVLGGYSHGQAITNDASARFTARILSQYKVLEKYFATYPEDREKIKLLHNKLTDKTCYSDGADEVCGIGMLTDFVGYLGFQYWDNLHEDIKALTDAIADHPDDWQKQKPWIYFAAAIIAQKGNLGSATVSRIEMQYKGASCSKTYKALQESNYAPETWLLHECLGSFDKTESYDMLPFEGSADSSQNQIANAFYNLKRDELQLSSIQEALKTHNDLRLYSYSSELDTFVPAQIYTYENNSLVGMPNFTYQHFMSSSHNGFYVEQAIAEDILN